jgi:hypothetical protein
MSFPPRAYLIGAQKAGTSTLAYLLDQHPRITVSRPKEPHYFTHNRDKGLDWYKTKFPDPSGNSVLLDASTSYTMAPLSTGGAGRQGRGDSFKGVPERVFSVAPDARFIYLLRDPVERTYSGYWHSVRTGRESRKFGDALKSDAFYLDVSDYHGQLARWLEYFSLGSFQFVLFEEMREAPERVARECFEFLSVDAGNVPVGLDSAKNQSRSIGWTGRRLNRLNVEHPGLDKTLKAALRPVVPESVRSWVHRLRRGDKPIPPMEEKDREYLIRRFREKKRRLEGLIDIPLDSWQM